MKTVTLSRRLPAPTAVLRLLVEQVLARVTILLQRHRECLAQVEAAAQRLAQLAPVPVVRVQELPVRALLDRQVQQALVVLVRVLRAQVDHVQPLA